MTPHLSPLQGRLLRSLALCLSNRGKDLMRGPTEGGLLVEAATVAPWSSLTFAGERHHLVVRLPPGTPASAVDSADLALPGAIVAVDTSLWSDDGSGPCLTLDLLVIAHPPC